MEIFNSMEGLRKKGYHIGKFEEIFTSEEIHFLKLVSKQIYKEFKNEKNIECKTQHTGLLHMYPFYEEETYIHPYTDLEKIDSFIEEKGLKIFQRWKNLKGSVAFDGYVKLKDLLNKIKLNIVTKCYDEFGFDLANLNLGGVGTIAMYEKGDKQPPHIDAGSEKTLYGIIVYLTPEEDWSEGMGGEFLINHTSEKITPTFGNYVLLDFVDNLIKHQVLELIGDYKRYTLISFPSIIDNRGENVLKFLEYKKSKKVFIP
jgi:Rps23 Pro-64 3,4-dihydroxylase Tpa1-like proline 4-hydroxylase